MKYGEVRGLGSDMKLLKPVGKGIGGRDWESQFWSDSRSPICEGDHDYIIVAASLSSAMAS